jgi:hypothetical protein
VFDLIDKFAPYLLAVALFSIEDGNVNVVFLKQSTKFLLGFHAALSILLQPLLSFLSFLCFFLQSGLEEGVSASEAISLSEREAICAGLDQHWVITWFDKIIYRLRAQSSLK